MKQISINGFGRIGRTAFRVWWQKHKDNLDLKIINTSGSMEIQGWVHLLKYDSNYGNFNPGIEFYQTKSVKQATDEDPYIGGIKIGDREIAVTAQRDPRKLPWSKHNIETVLECTGVFRDDKTAAYHLEAGAQKVLISAPAKGDNITSSVIGVNEFDHNKKIFSNASCTTNCVAPVVKIIKNSIGIKKAIMTTIHSYTDNQNTQDNSHKKDLRRARSAAENLIPTSTGAAKATTKIIPELKNLFDGMAVRVPTPVGSISDMVFVTQRDTTIEEVNKILTQASESEPYKGIIAVTNEPIVSSDIVGRDQSSIVDLSLTQVIGGDLVKIISWYDNEWGYCCRLMDQIYRI